jgi:4-hydroxybenzoate polyprenyltransferase
MAPMPDDGAHAVDAPLPGPSVSAIGALWRGLRVRDWAHFTVLPLASTPMDALDGDGLFALARSVLVAALVLAWGYLSNGLADRALDRDASKNPFAGLAPRAVETLRSVAWAFAIAALVLASLGGGVPFAAAATSITAGWLYSSGPRLKRFPIVGTLLNVACFAPLLFVGAAHALPPAVPLFTLAFTGLLLGNQLLHEAADAHDDAAGRVRTTFLALGPRGAAAFAAVAGALPVIALALALPGLLRIALSAAALFVFVVVVPGALALRGAESRRMARARLLHRVASVAVGALLFALAHLHA